MKYDKLKRGIVSLALTGSILLGAGFVGSAFALNSSVPGQYPQRDRDWDRRRERDNRYWDRRREREELQRIRRLDRAQQLRYRYSGANRIIGYYDRFGRFQAYGYYDRFGRFYRY